MSEAAVPVTGVGIERLEAYLESDRSPSACLGISDLDGFLTAIAIGPELVMPSEWMPVIWGGEAPVFADEDEMKAVLGGVMSRFNEIIHEVEDGTFEPILWETADHVVIASDWAEGFMLAIELRPEAWKPLVAAKNDGYLLFPIVALCGDEQGGSLLGLDAEAEDEVAKEAPEVLPACVVGIADFWRKRRESRRGIIDLVEQTIRSTPKPGRNDPCPCGSGRKFKRCCGSAA